MVDYYGKLVGHGDILRPSAAMRTRLFRETFVQPEGRPSDVHKHHCGSTVGEFFEKSSEVRQYTRTADSPAPKRMTVKFVVRAVVLFTVCWN